MSAGVERVAARVRVREKHAQHRLAAARGGLDPVDLVSLQGVRAPIEQLAHQVPRACRLSIRGCMSTYADRLTLLVLVAATPPAAATSIKAPRPRRA